MRMISERDLSVLIPLLFNKIEAMTKELRALEANVHNLNDRQADELCVLQERIEQYDSILDTLREEYESGLAEGNISNLPTYDKLIRKNP